MGTVVSVIRNTLSQCYSRHLFLAIARHTKGYKIFFFENAQIELREDEIFLSKRFYSSV